MLLRPPSLPSILRCRCALVSLDRRPSINEKTWPLELSSPSEEDSLDLEDYNCCCISRRLALVTILLLELLLADF